MIMLLLMLIMIKMMMMIFICSFVDSDPFVPISLLLSGFGLYL